ncbi:hypothetical protein EIN_176840 [Entamoeba invadens IP1]|uniref:hypothetical protein n=1 Tax=Entamoeba invadens IP1 TaxID=370355 RepID=UPI0002C3D4D3|nr:hypothetical protein EIN_176840 [Entamoeba invadens IP1]ELP93857.1 hypothetical protein EIN_176840 [Entamoeba invadens IP1]|eukprot:XP_004260628.1 hypothetical protein EIN_176840 [Entamoeba invadens IP1]
MSSLGKLFQHSGYNVLSMFYNKLGGDTQNPAVFVPGAPLFLLGIEYKTTPLKKQAQELPQSSLLQYSSMAAYVRMSNLLWMTYRSGYEKLPNSSLNTDVGWGCTIRAVQMMISNAMQTLVYKHDLTSSTTPYIPKQNEILNVVIPFVDFFEQTTPLSIHHVYESRFVVEQNKSGVNYLAPTIVAKAYSDLVNSWKMCALRCVMASNTSIPLCDIKKEPFKPTLVFLPIIMDQLVKSRLQQIYKFNMFAGIVSGIGDRAVYIFGFHVMRCLFLDPHTVQPAAESFTKIDLKSYAPINPTLNRFAIHSIELDKIDQFCTFGFLIKSLEEVDAFEKFCTETFDISHEKELRTSISEVGGFEVLDF